GHAVRRRGQRRDDGHRRYGEIRSDDFQRYGFRVVGLVRLAGSLAAARNRTNEVITRLGGGWNRHVRGSQGADRGCGRRSRTQRAERDGSQEQVARGDRRVGGEVNVEGRGGCAPELVLEAGAHIDRPTGYGRFGRRERLHREIRGNGREHVDPRTARDQAIARGIVLRIDNRRPRG